MIGDLKCPICGGEMTEASKGYSCSKWKKEDGGCKFTIWKESYGAVFSESDVEALLKGETIRKTNISKTGKQYEADWYLDEENKAAFKYVNENKN